MAVYGLQICTWSPLIIRIPLVRTDVYRFLFSLDATWRVYSYGESQHTQKKSID